MFSYQIIIIVAGIVVKVLFFCQRGDLNGNCFDDFGFGLSTRYCAMITEALTALKEPNGSEVELGAIRSFIEVTSLSLLSYYLKSSLLLNYKYN